MSKLEKLAAGRPMRVVARTLYADAEQPFTGATFREAHEHARGLLKGWYWYGLFAGDELVLQVWRVYP